MLRQSKSGGKQKKTNKSSEKSAKQSSKTNQSSQSKGSGMINLKSQKNPQTKSSEHTKPTMYTVKPWIVFLVIFAARLVSAIWGNINDCDETFNYWEPIHYLLYGTGYQTWEYSPSYAIRSYTYLWFYALPAKVLSYLFDENKILVFYAIRCYLALFCALCETYFYRGVLKSFGAGASRFVFLILTFSTGLFISSTAVLPNSFSMYMSFLIIGSWLQNHIKITILSMGLSSAIGWPFSALLNLPVLLNLLFTKRRRNHALKWMIGLGALVSIPLIGIDSYYYGKLVLAPLNIILYNVFTSHGANLYGVEPWSYYFVNAFLNFNIILATCFLSLPLMGLSKLLRGKSRKDAITINHWIVLISLALFFTTLSLQAHKEERFLFPAYPHLCLIAAITFDLLQKIFASSLPKIYPTYSVASLGFLLNFFLISILRALALIKGYGGSIETFTQLNNTLIDNGLSSLDSINLCIGKEWYRFPSSFFLPDSRWKLQFIKSEFKGLLPQPFTHGSLGTRVIPSNMNDRNEEEPSRYIPVSQCHFLIDTDIEKRSPSEPNYSQSSKWDIKYSAPLLDNTASPRFWRSFYLPFIFHSNNQFVNFNLLKNRNLKGPNDFKKGSRN
ncbi:alpha-1,2-mannosyltransferase ALG9-like [Brevipalpus obovatus]|uniref:alpha-1,2-mannosyltransferase ALG9-like n=1 Tax=Brevipalpus obovatus TaxID=246614 RepID=UPI003D9F9115